MKWKGCGGAKTSWYFLLNDKYRCPSGRFPLFVNEFYKNNRFQKRSFFKTIVLKTTIFKKRTFLIFRRLFYNETIVFQKKENVNTPR